MLFTMYPSYGAVLQESGADKTPAAYQRPSGLLDFLHTMRLFAERHGCASVSIEERLDSKVTAVLDTIFLKGGPSASVEPAETLARCSFTVSRSLLVPSFAEPVFRAVDLIPRDAVSAALKNIIEGGNPLEDPDSWNGLKYARRVMKFGVNGRRIFTESHSGGRLATVNWALGRIKDLVKHGGDVQEVRMVAAQAQTSWERMNRWLPDSFEQFDSPGGILLYLQNELQQMDLNPLGGGRCLIKDLHRCRKAMQSHINYYRLAWIAEGGSSPNLSLEFRTLVSLSSTLGALHDSFVGMYTRGEIDYETALVDLDPALLGQIEAFRGATEFAL